MLFRIGLENNIEGRSLAWALEFPGCFAYGADSASALAAVPRAVRDYAAWLAAHGETFDPEPIKVKLYETWNDYTIDQDFNLVAAPGEDVYEVNAWFRHDWKPLTAEEIAHGQQLLSWSRQDLLETVRGLDTAALERQYPNERWSIAGILRHVGGAEWWYLDRLGLAFPREQIPAEPFDRLQKVRAHLNTVLPSLVASSQVVGVSGEFWSPRKLLRRAIWHELDHVAHIRKLLQGV